MLAVLSGEVGWATWDLWGKGPELGQLPSRGSWDQPKDQLRRHGSLSLRSFQASLP